MSLHERHGFEQLGTFRDVGDQLGARRDVRWYHLRLLAPPRRPEPPRAWTGTLGA